MDSVISQEMLDRIGVYQHGVIDTDSIGFHTEVRKMCEDNVCRNYGKTWACPPGVGTLDECRARLQKYDKMLLFSVKYDLEDSFDFEGMKDAMREFKVVSRNLSEEVEPYLSDYLVLSNEGCGICESCTYPDNPCRFPDKLQESIEGYGIFVSKVAQKAGIRYINGANTVTFFGGLLYNDVDIIKK